MTDTTEKLLLCPFCGSDAERVFAEEYGYRAIECITCLAKMEGGTKEEVIDAWNRRAAEKPKWTTEIPTEEGWYWMYSDVYPDYAEYEGGCDMPALTQITSHNNRLHVMIYRKKIHASYCLKVFCQVDKPLWQKIDIPTLPEEGENDEI